MTETRDPERRNKYIVQIRSTYVNFGSQEHFDGSSKGTLSMSDSMYILFGRTSKCLY